MRTRHRVWVFVGVLAFVTGACGANGANSADDEETPTTELEQSAEITTFGTGPSPCGEAPDGVTVTVKADEAGGSPDTIRIGVANERSSTIRPGLLKEFYDASVAFAGWCNAQGGIAGLPVEVVDLDGQILKVDEAMAKACTGVFAMVGGGFAQDNLMFTDRDGTDFHKCKLIAFPAISSSTDLAEGNGQVQAMPNPANVRSSAWISDLVELYPEEMKKTTVVFGDLPTLRNNKDQIYGIGQEVEGFGSAPEVSYDAIGTADWNLVAQQVVASGATAASFVGEPTNFSKLEPEAEGARLGRRPLR